MIKSLALIAILLIAGCTTNPVERCESVSLTPAEWSCSVAEYCGEFAQADSTKQTDMQYTLAAHDIRASCWDYVKGMN